MVQPGFELTVSHSVSELTGVQFKPVSFPFFYPLEQII